MEVGMDAGFARHFQSATTHRLSRRQRQKIFDQDIAPTLYASCNEVSHPSVHFLGGQPGSGKSRLRYLIQHTLENDDGNNSVAWIGIDEYRKYHPGWGELLSQEEAAAGELTNQDCWEWSLVAKNYVINRRCHVVKEGTLRNPVETLADAKDYVEAGYTAELHIIAVHEFISRYRYLHRYISEIETEGHGRYIQVIERVPCGTPASAARVRAVLSEQRNPTKINKAILLHDIDDLLGRAALVNRPQAVQEIMALRHDVEDGVPSDPDHRY